MPRERLRSILTELHEQLSRSETIDGGDREQLRLTLASIHAILDGEESSTPQASTLGATLEDAMRRFEASHPTLAEVLRRTIDTLAQSGI